MRFATTAKNIDTDVATKVVKLFFPPLSPAWLELFHWFVLNDFCHARLSLKAPALKKRKGSYWEDRNVHDLN